ncbi:metallophosphoesterase family protein [Marinobacterium jannaschii]|uniref:metallophosphoesterase family protein n=1 Tax=Marinobacterium jannaschii TaxID=64970 RepID=UPI0004819D73|nr:metallophosphoesterase family protein [Marinobacterium jannaschii]
MTCIAHLSDLHFGRARSVLVGALLEALAAEQPDMIIISGDLTQRARRREFQAAREFLSRLEQPYMIIPGNHDLSAHRLAERFLYPWRKWRYYVSEELEPVMHCKGVTAAGINTARRLGFYLDWSRGRINQQQVASIREVLSEVPEDHLRIVVAHHPFWLPDSRQKRNLIGGRDSAMEAFQASGVDLVLGGHIHLAYVQLLQGIIVSHAGTTVSRRLIEGQPNSFNMIRGDRQQLMLEQLEWDGQRFSQVCRNHFRRSPDGWQYQLG